ncbi:TM2 domain-containing protein almondex [Leptopilina heterotoma]|uniref:TM2 domain-containing protein almondex n=1 Tax=Leptopilina heterotoma TaxID=63436 RepID=UPI001CA99C8D|nr:TM2 domain-containing protein almondex [Leptopilina heterotoma]
MFGMNVVRINSKNVIFLILGILSTTIKQAHMGYESIASYALKDANTNSTPAFSNRKEESINLCPTGGQCSELGGECLKCNFNANCVYGDIYKVNCTVLDQVDCIGETTIEKTFMCRYCYQTEHWEHKCQQKNSCSSIASPQQYYRTNCTVNSDVICLGRRTFLKNLPCNWTGGYRWSTAFILSITLGGFGADRFYLGHWQEGIGKLFSFGGLGVWTLIDVMLISMRYLGPADGSLYI